MAELGIGVLFAIWFIVMYLLVSRWRKRDKQLYGPVSLNPLDTAKLLGAQQKQQRRFLTTEAMSQHHARKKGSPSAGSDH
jgi:hypothetical protein